MHKSGNWRWILTGLLLAGMVFWSSCGGGDDDDSADVQNVETATGTGSATTGGTSTNVTSGGGTSTNPAPGATLNTNLLVNLRTNITLPSLQTVLLDKRVIVTDTASVTVTANPAPGAGTVKVTATWTTEDLMAGGAPIDIPLEFWLNQGGSGGSLHNAGHKSPWSGAVGVPAGQACKIQVINNVVKSRATVGLKAVWTAN